MTSRSERVIYLNHSIELPHKQGLGMVEGSLRGHQPLPMVGGSASAIIDNEGAAVAEHGGVLEDGEGRRHKAMNPTTRKVHCRFHSEVVVKRHKLRTASVWTPCWRCLEVRGRETGEHS